MVLARFLKFTTTLALTLLGMHTAEASIKNCGSGASQLEITELNMLPDPPIRGKPFELVLKANNNGAEINGGSITTSLTLNFIPFAPSTTALYDDVNCPILPGLNDFGKTATWPDTVSGAVSSKVVWNDISNNELLCVQINTKVASNSKLRHETNFTQFDANMFMKTLTYLKDPEAFNSDCLTESFSTV